MTNNDTRSVSSIFIVFLVIGLVIFLLLGGIPAIYTALLSINEYSLIHGIWDSPWVGMHYYGELVSTGMLGRMLGNSFILSFMPVIIAVIVAVPVAGVVGAMKPGWMRSLCTVALVLPAFIPDSILAYTVQYMSTAPAFTGAASFRLVTILLSSIEIVAVGAFVGACAAGIYKDRGGNVVSGAIVGVLIGVAVSLVRFLSVNVELVTMFNNLHVTQYSETFGMVGRQAGLITMQFPLASATWIIKTVLQLVAAVLVSVVVFKAIRGRLDGSGDGLDGIGTRLDGTGERLNGIGGRLDGTGDGLDGIGGRHDGNGGNGSGIDGTSSGAYSSDGRTQSGIVPGFVFIVLTLVGLLLPATLGNASGGTGLIQVGNSVFMTVFAAVIFGVLTFSLALWLCVNMRHIGALILVLLMVAIVDNVIGEVMFYRLLGLVDTRFAVIFASGFSLVFVLPLAYLTRLKNPGSTSISSTLRGMFPYFIVFCGLFIANTWGSRMHQHTMLRTRAHWGVPLEFWSAFLDGAVSGRMVLALTLPVLIIAGATVLIYLVISRKENRRETSAEIGTM